MAKSFWKFCTREQLQYSVHTREMPKENKIKKLIKFCCSLLTHSLYAQNEQRCRLLVNMQKRYLMYLICTLTATEHIGNTWVYYYPHSKLYHYSFYRTLSIWLCCYQQIRTKCAKELFIMRIWWWPTTCAFGNNRQHG